MLKSTILDLSPTQFKGWINTTNTQACTVQITGLVGTAGLHRGAYAGKRETSVSCITF